jgi:hypothetical protein
LLALFALALLALGRSERALMRGTSARLLRSLFPSWRFFEAGEPSLCLLVRVLQDGRELTPFAPVLPAQPRGVGALLLNPRGNLLLACHALLEQLVDRLAEQGATPLQEAEQLPEYRLVQNLACAFLAPRPGAHYQLKLISTAPGAGQSEELFVSPPYPLS